MCEIDNDDFFNQLRAAQRQRPTSTTPEGVYCYRDVCNDVRPEKQPLGPAKDAVPVPAIQSEIKDSILRHISLPQSGAMGRGLLSRSSYTIEFPCSGSMTRGNPSGVFLHGQSDVFHDPPPPPMPEHPLFAEEKSIDERIKRLTEIRWRP